jgi:hypothetical protein
MPLSMYDASIPLFKHYLTSLSAILKKGEAHAEARKIAPQVFLTARLAPDMHPLTRQVQMASDAVKGATARLAGIEIPSFPDDEASFAELQARIAKTLVFLDSVSPDKFEGAEQRSIELKAPNRTFSFTGKAYLFQFALPNFYFHVTTAYDILRHNGVELGKADYLGL